VVGARLGAVLEGLRPVVLFLILIVLLYAFFVKGTPAHGALPFLSREGFAAGVYYALRVLVLYAAIVVFLTVASQEAVAKGLAALLRPISPGLARRAAFYGFLSLGFLPLFADEVKRIRIAQGFRGGGLRGGLWAKITGVRLLLVPILLSAIHRSGQLAMAVELRGIRDSMDRLLVLDRPAYKDFVFTGVTLVVLMVAYLMG
jgi:energy-coupling factor transport system permease protein